MPEIKPIIKPCKIFICGEAPGAQEELLGIPFVGSSGDILKSMLSEVGIDYNSCSVSNVFLERPEGNKIENFCVKKAEAGYDHVPPLSQGKYFRKELLGNRERLWREITESGANVVLALGNTACWALLDKTGIGSLRGAVTSSPHVGAKIIPAYHPAAIMRNWELRHVTIVDLMKTLREQNTKEIAYDEVKIIMEPSLADLQEFYLRAKESPGFAYDIETKPSRRQILCVGFGLGGLSLVCPFVDRRKRDYNYWSSLSDELKAWDFVKAMLKLPCRKFTQNGLYDISWLWKIMGIAPAGRADDTMLFHHSLFPEMTKGLDFLGSVYCNLPAWKGMHRRGEFNKKED